MFLAPSLSAKCDTAVETTNIIAKEVTEIVTNTVNRRQDAFEEQNSARFDALDQHLAALLGLLKTQHSQSPTNSQETPQHPQQNPQQHQRSHLQNSQATLPHLSQQQPGLSLRNDSQNSNEKFNCDFCIRSISFISVTGLMFWLTFKNVCRLSDELVLFGVTCNLYYKC